jgi:uncharacterized protein (DUF1800 family)
MVLGRAKFAAFLVCFGLACTVPQLLAKKDKAASSLNDPRRALHALNRLSFGPRPGDLQQVMAMGVDRWIDLQLHPDKIDDSALTARLEPLRTIRMSSKEIAEDFPDPQEINQIINGKKAMPSDPARRAVYQVQVARVQAQKERKQEAGKNFAVEPPQKSAPQGDETSMAANSAAGANGNANVADADNRTADNSAMNAMSGAANGEMNSASANDTMPRPTPPRELSPEDKEQARRREEALYADLDVQQLPSLPPDQRFKKVLSMNAQEQFAFADTLRGGKGQEFLEGMNPKQKETLLAMNNPAIVVMSELMQAKMLRAVYSQRQLDEVMTDFWFNHFNVFMEKGLDRVLVTSYERDVIRPHALGKFEDLLVATAKSPAMLFYLDNFLSVGPNSPQALGIPARPNGRGPYARRYPPQRPRPQGKRSSGLNENYGRELLELHTLSVNGGYSQRDVTEVAKVFTGWTIDKPAEGGSFKFDPRTHEPGTKYVLGHKIKPKGDGEGLEVLHRLATSPQTAHFISLKLAQRFVADDPPPALIDRMAQTFLKKKGDIREVLSTLFHSPEFWDDASYRTKMKTPLEFVASAVRATGADVDDALPLARQLNNMGMPLYSAQPPTGYSMKAETWVSSSALLNRMNFALALTSGKIKGVKVDAAHLDTPSAGAPNADVPTPAPDFDAALSALESSLIPSGISKQTHDSIAAQVTGEKNPALKPQPVKPPDVNAIAGLLLGSPEFQRR